MFNVCHLRNPGLVGKVAQKCSKLEAIYKYFSFVVIVVSCCFRLPETDDCGRDNHRTDVSFPVAACICSYSSSISSTLSRCSCPLSDGLALKWAR